MKSRSRFRLWSLLLLATGGMALAACGGSNYSVSSADSSVSSASSSQSSSEPSTPAHVHRWGDPTWEWHQEGETFHVHAVFTCLDDASHVEEVNATVTRESLTYATCETNGSATYVATVEHGGNTFSASQTITLPATQHEIETKWNFDNTKHWHACAHDATEHFDEAPHQLATRYIGTVTASCQGDVSRDEETYCTVCGVVISTKRSILRAINHDYQLVDS
ncbi:MAG: hypothetical protein IJU64_07280 [Bacilli bacterium]|nr:hypothetical protein [Bacilli bacterium]